MVVLVIWSTAAWRTWSRAVSVKARPELLDDLKVYETIRADFEGIPEVWLLVEKPTERRLRTRPRGQVQKAQYTLAPTVVYKVASADVAALKVRSTKELTVILHFFVSSAHRDQVEELLRQTASSRRLKTAARRVGGNLVLYRFESREGPKS